MEDVMDALVVVESVSGNTRRIAETVADEMGARVHTRVVDDAERSAR
jgi:flavodoxin